MRKLTISQIKQRKYQVVNNYRLRLQLLNISIYLIIAEIIILIFLYWRQPEPEVYSTNSDIGITKLSFSAPNIILPKGELEDVGDRNFIL